MPPRLGNGSIGEHNSHSDNEVAQTAELQPKRAAVVGGDDAAHGGAVRPKRIERDHLPVASQFRLHRGPRAAGFNGAGHVLPGMLAESVHATFMLKLDVRRNWIAPAQLGAAAGGRHRESVGCGKAQHLRNLPRVSGSGNNRFSATDVYAPCPTIEAR